MNEIDDLNEHLALLPPDRLTFTLCDEFDPVAAKQIHGRIKAFNNVASPHHRQARTAGRTALYILVRDRANALVAGLIASTYWQWLDIDDFWLHENLRGQGLGRAMLARAEQEAIARGCTRAMLSTFNFQARGFYEKQGYRVVGALEDYPPGGAMYWMRKDFTAS